MEPGHTACEGETENGKSEVKESKSDHKKTVRLLNPNHRQE